MQLRMIIEEFLISKGKLNEENNKRSTKGKSNNK
jgi:hypothetical protein